jgi:hypothetical protein
VSQYAEQHALGLNRELVGLSVHVKLHDNLCLVGRGCMGSILACQRSFAPGHIVCFSTPTIGTNLATST